MRLTAEQYRAQIAKPKCSKYGAKRTTVDGINFDSMAEAKKYQILRLRERAGEIRNLVPHPFLTITINGMKICRIEADAAWFEGDKRVFWDCKGADTAISKLKRRLVQAQFPGIEWRVEKA
jgi:hypothetical protein